MKKSLVIGVLLALVLALTPGVAGAADAAAYAPVGAEAAPAAAPEDWDALEAADIARPMAGDDSLWVVSQSGQKSLAGRTAEDLAVERVYARQFSFTERFAETPSVTAPFAAGALSADYQRTAQARLDYLRLAAGLPRCVPNADWSDMAQHAAVLLAANDKLSLSPAQPEGMEDDFYDMGLTAVASSNISSRTGPAGANYLISALNGCMSDNSAASMRSLGHRRWLINPYQTMWVGFGEAISESNKYYIVTRSFSADGDFPRTRVDYDFVAWPASGLFPAELLGMADPWSIMLNPNRFEVPKEAEITVTITREADGASWTLDQGADRDTPDNKEPYFHVDTGNFGVNNCIIFTPGRLYWDAEGFDGRYSVVVTGLEKKGGGPAELRYDVDFFDVAAVDLPEVEAELDIKGGCTVEGTTSGPAGSNLSFRLVPDADFRLVSLRVNGAELEELPDNFFFERVLENQRIEALFLYEGEADLSDGLLTYRQNGTEMTVTGLADPDYDGALRVPEQYLGCAVTALGMGALQNCICESVTLPDSVVTVGRNALRGADCRSIDLGAGLRQLGRDALRGATIHGSLSLPADLETLGTGALTEMPNLSAFAVTGEGPLFVRDGVLYVQREGEPETLLRYPLGSKRSFFVVPDSTEALGDGCFAGAAGLERIYAMSHAIRAEFDSFAGDDITVYCHTDAPLYGQGAELEGTVRLLPLDGLDTFALEPETRSIRVFNRSGETMSDTLVAAEYSAGRCVRVRVWTLDLPDGALQLLDLGDTGAETDSLRLFYVKEGSFVPLMEDMTL